MFLSSADRSLRNKVSTQVQAIERARTEEAESMAQLFADAVLSLATKLSKKGSWWDCIRANHGHSEKSAAPAPARMRM